MAGGGGQGTENGVQQQKKIMLYALNIPREAAATVLSTFHIVARSSRSRETEKDETSGSGLNRARRYISMLASAAPHMLETSSPRLRWGRKNSDENFPFILIMLFQVPQGSSLSISHYLCNFVLTPFLFSLSLSLSISNGITF